MSGAGLGLDVRRGPRVIYHGAFAWPRGSPHLPPSISVVETICGLTRLSSHASNDGKNDFSNGVSFHKPESLGLTRYFHP